MVGRGPKGAVAVVGLTASLVAATAPATAQDGLVQAAVPVAPEVLSRMPDGRVTIRAIRLSEPLRLDGQLDEEIYRTAKAIDGFLQTLPDEGAPVSERTEAYVFFDDENIYICGRMWESAPPDQWVANEMRRDTGQLRQNDIFGVLLDTFHDRRNGYNFYTNPLGARADQAVTDEGNPNLDWNPVWEARTGRFEGGWTVELGIPFKSIRYQQGTGQTWGIQIRRGIRRKNEWAHVTAVPASTGGAQGILRVSSSATLVGLEPPPVSANIELKPYVISGVATDRLSTPARDNEFDRDIGIDAKYGVTANLTADLTVNTDFAQVDVDEQQVNLTRFSLFFPEKREFFLEGRGIFDFGRGGGAGGGGGGFGGADVTPSLFYSRRIGLNNARVIPIDVGGRLTGKVGPFSVGVVNIQTREQESARTPSTNFTVMRLRRDILRRSSVGVIFTNRSESIVAAGSNQAYGADASFAFFENVRLSGYAAQTRTPGGNDDAESFMARADYGADRYGARLEYLHVGDNFNPEVGFVRRDDFRRTFGTLRFSPRPTSIEAIRRFTYEASLEYIENGSGQLESRRLTGQFNIEFESSDQFEVEVNDSYELLADPFEVADDVTLSVGGYSFKDFEIAYMMGQQRRISGMLTLQRGEFYNGTITGATLQGARVSVTDQLSVEPSVSVNHVELPNGEFTTRLLRARTDYAFSPRMFATALLQFASDTHVLGSNFRFRWEYLPGSELFVVYTDERNTLGLGYPDLRNRAFAVKVNRLLRF
jgi:hypothetical protein